MISFVLPVKSKVSIFKSVMSSLPAGKGEADDPDNIILTFWSFGGSKYSSDLKSDACPSVVGCAWVPDTTARKKTARTMMNFQFPGPEPENENARRFRLILIPSIFPEK